MQQSPGVTLLDLLFSNGIRKELWYDCLPEHIIHNIFVILSECDTIGAFICARKVCKSWHTKTKALAWNVYKKKYLLGGGPSSRCGVTRDRTKHFLFERYWNSNNSKGGGSRSASPKKKYNHEDGGMGNSLGKSFPTSYGTSYGTSSPSTPTKPDKRKFSSFGLLSQQMEVAYYEKFDSFYARAKTRVDSLHKVIKNLHFVCIANQRSNNLNRSSNYEEVASYSNSAISQISLIFKEIHEILKSFKGEYACDTSHDSARDMVHKSGQYITSELNDVYVNFCNEVESYLYWVASQIKHMRYTDKHRADMLETDTNQQVIQYNKSKVAIKDLLSDLSTRLFPKVVDTSHISDNIAVFVENAIEMRRRNKNNKSEAVIDVFQIKGEVWYKPAIAEKVKKYKIIILIGLLILIVLGVILVLHIFKRKLQFI